MRLLPLLLLVDLGVSCSSGVSNGGYSSMNSIASDPAAGAKCYAAGKALDLHPSSVVIFVENALDPRDVHAPSGIECSLMIDSGEIVGVFVPPAAPPFLVGVCSSDVQPDETTISGLPTTSC